MKEGQTLENPQGQGQSAVERFVMARGTSVAELAELAVTVAVTQRDCHPVGIFATMARVMIEDDILRRELVKEGHKYLFAKRESLPWLIEEP